ncbi:MAG: hypothetical protein ACR2JK_15040 [Geodermatophilaceae bacterium]
MEPRLVAAWSAAELSARPEPLTQGRDALGERYGVDFDSVLVNFYRTRKNWT